MSFRFFFLDPLELKIVDFVSGNFTANLELVKLEEASESFLVSAE